MSPTTTEDDRLLPIKGIGEKLRQAIAHALKVSEEDLKKFEVGVRKEGDKIVIVLKTDIHKLKTELGNLIHHKHFSRDAVDTSNNKKELIFDVPPAVHNEVNSIYETLNSHEDDSTKLKVLENLSEKIFNKNN